MGEWHEVSDVRGTSVAAMLREIYPDIDDYNLKRTIAKFDASTEAQGIRIAGYAWSWNFLVAADDDRAAEELIRTGLSIRLG